MTKPIQSGQGTSEKAIQLEITSENIAHITFDQPGSRANTLGQATMAELEAVFSEVQAKSDLKGLIFQSRKPGMFIAGADIKELGKAVGDPEQSKAVIQRGHDLFNKIQSLPFPTVVLIDGACMGGGTEMALAFDYRLAGSHPKTEIGLPEVKLGLIPGWGGTQRLSRLIGPALAAEYICSGDGVKAEKARELGIVFDVIPSDQLLQEGHRLIHWAQESGEWQNIRKRKEQPVGVSEDQLAFTYAVTQGSIMAKTKGQYPAPLAALDAIVKGCNLPLEEGLKVEMKAFAPLVGSSISQNLIAVFFMTQQLQKDTGVSDPGVKPKEIHQVGVAGAGIMGSGIAGAHVRRGVPAAMVDKFPEALAKGAQAIAKMMQSRVAIGRMTQEEVLGAISKLNSGADYSLLAYKDVVIEAIVEDEPTKVELFKELQSILKPDAILASNTSTISITRMAEAVKSPDRFAGMHFFNPVDRMQLVEVIRGEKTSDETTTTLVALAKRIGKTPIVVKDCPGFLVNRILFPYLNEALILLEEGADPRLLDKVATGFGMPMGPITLQDLVGLDTSFYAGKVISKAFPDRTASNKILGELVQAGRLGKKTGAGFYSYAKGSKGGDDPAFGEILDRCRASSSKEFSKEELTDRLFLPMLTEASRVLSEGIVRSPADVDMGLILGIGFPAFRGGILRWADTMGLPAVAEKMKSYASLGARFQPTDLITKLAKENKGFYPA